MTERRDDLAVGVAGLPIDLWVVNGWVAATILVLAVPVVRESPLRIAVGVPLLLFIPGYALVAALFPERGSHGDEKRTTSWSGARGDSGLDTFGRLVLSLALSVTIGSLTALVMDFTPRGIRVWPIVLTLAAITVGATAVAAFRRRQLSPEERYRVPYRKWGTVVRNEFVAPASKAHFALNVVIALGVLVSLVSVSYVATTSRHGEQFTELSVLTRTENGSLVAADYPIEYDLGESGQVVVSITNREHHPENYTIVVGIQRLREKNGTARVVEQRILRRITNIHLRHKQRWRQRITLEPSMVGDRVRVVFLLYRGAPPENPSVKNAYREVHLWITVTPSDRVTNADRSSRPSIVRRAPG